jgi:hypothetical protein
VYLKWKENKKQVDSKTANNLQILRRFDPKQRRRQSEQISLLITTDVLSEGVNLQAGEVMIKLRFSLEPDKINSESRKSR